MSMFWCFFVGICSSRPYESVVTVTKLTFILVRNVPISIIILIIYAMQLFEAGGRFPRYSCVLMPPNAGTAAEEMNQWWFCWGGEGAGEP